MIILNGFPVNITMFPDNTSQVWKLKEGQIETYNKIKWEYSGEGEFIHLAQLKDLIEVENKPVIAYNVLDITYLPYARQDKEIRNNTTFSLNTFAKLLNSLEFDEISILDPHSHRAIELIKNSREYYPKQAVLKVIDLTKSDVVCYPDKGAVCKYSTKYDVQYVYGEKERDAGSGKISNYKLFGNVEGKNVLIVDDICDGGATFILLATALLNTGAKNIALFVSHGIFSKGLRPLKSAWIKRIFTPMGEVGVHQEQLTYKELPL